MKRKVRDPIQSVNLEECSNLYLYWVAEMVRSVELTPSTYWMPLIPSRPNLPVYWCTV